MVDSKENYKFDLGVKVLSGYESENCHICCSLRKLTKDTLSQNQERFWCHQPF